MIRPFLSFLLLACFLLYQFGYLLLCFWMPKAIQTHWEEQIWSEKLETTSKVYISIPFAKPYGQDQQEYQVANFPIEWNGKSHRVLYQQYRNDSLHLIAVSDEMQERFLTQLNTWINSVNSKDIQDELPPLQKLLLKSFIKDYIPLQEQSLDPNFQIALLDDDPFTPYFLRLSIGKTPPIQVPPQDFLV